MQRLLFAFALAIVPAWSLSVTVQSTDGSQGVSSQQAVMQIAGASGACTLEVSESASYSPLIPDVDGTLHAGSNTDTGRADTITWANGTRIVTLGHRNDDRSLKVATLYYYRVSGCGGTVTGTFTTVTLPVGITQSSNPPFNASKWGNMDFPTFDWTTSKVYTDPMTGAVLRPINITLRTWRTGGGGTGGQPGLYQTFADWSGGSGWTNPSHVLNGSTTDATTGNTNTLDLFADWTVEQLLAYDVHRLMEDIAGVVWGQGSSSTAADRQITLDLRVHGGSCGTATVTLPTGAVAHVVSGSSDPDGAFPAAFPSNPFFGWSGSKQPCIRNEDVQTGGTLSVSGSTLTIASPTASNHFSSGLVAGDRIFVSNSAPGCTNNLCTVATNVNATTVTVSETPSGTGSQSYRAYGWFIRVSKANANGTVTIGLKYKLAGSNAPLGIQPGGDNCGPVSQVSGDGKVGYVCQFTSLISGIYVLAFVASDDTVRIFSDQVGQSVGGASFDPAQGNVFYAGATNGSGGKTVIKYTYTSDYTENLDYGYGCGSGGGCPTLNEHLTTTDLMPHGSNADLDQQIQANQGGSLPAYNSSLYGNWNSLTVDYKGSTGHYAVYCNVYAGQGQIGAGGPGWCAVIDLTPFPATVVQLIHTLDGTGCANCRFGSLHAPLPQTSRDNTLFLSLDDLTTNSSSTLHGGPFQSSLTGVLQPDGVTWNANTALPWPPDTSYYRTCPNGTQVYTECASFRMTQPCNISPTAAELAAFPCAWNGAFSEPTTLRVNDNMADMAASGAFDSEHFKVLAITLISGNNYRVDVARNAVYDYCSISPWHGQTNAFSAQGPTQLVHASGWTPTMMPGARPGVDNSCGAAVIVKDLSTGVIQELGHSFSGHFGIGKGPTGNINFVTSTFSLYDIAFGSMDQIPPVLNTTSDMAFHGILANTGVPNALQSYTNSSQFNAASSDKVWALDLNPFVGCANETFGCGPVRTVTHVTGDIYKIQSAGSASASEATYKAGPMMGHAGRYILQDVSGPGSSVSTPFTSCFAVAGNECQAGSLASDVYVNVPKMYDPGFCQPGESWANTPCIIFGLNAPADIIRQFRVSANDTGGQHSRAVSSAMASVGRRYPYSHGSTLPSGKAVMALSTFFSEGHGLLSWLIDLPPWQDDNTVRNDFVTVPITLSAGLQYGRVRFGYGMYGLPTYMNCTARADACVTDRTAAPYAFLQVDALAPANNCTAGCTINVPALANQVLYYRVERSSDGITFGTGADINAIVVAPVLAAPSAPSKGVMYGGGVVRH